MFLDFLIILKWWLYILLIGIIFLPFTQKYLYRFLDKGYIFSKFIGILLTSFLVWLLSALKLAPFSDIIIYGVILLFIIINIYLLFTNNLKVKNINVKTLVICLAEELIFLFLLICWCYIRGVKPEINGLEKFMDFGFINAILRADYMPPMDIWFAGVGINYYYFGHFVCAFLTKLTNIDSAITYNLMISTIFALTFLFSFSVALNIIFVFNKEKLKNAIIAGIISALMVTFAGNLHGFTYAYAKPFINKNITFTKSDYKYYYPNSTRYIGHNPANDDKTIHEFPIYSFVVSDVHGHVSDIPIVLLYLALLLACATEYYFSRVIRFQYIIILSILLSVMYMTNAWDYPIYFTVTLATIIAFSFKNLSTNDSTDNNRTSYLKKLKPLIVAISIFILSQLFLIPFNKSFDMISNSIGLVKSHSPIYQLLILWGHQFFFSLCFIGYIIFKTVVYFKNKSNQRNFNDYLNKFNPSEVLNFVLVCCALGLVLLPEIVFVVDIYVKTYHRANTMFKLTFQAFIMFGITTGFIVVTLLEKINKKIVKLSVIFIFILFLTLPMLYPFMCINGYYGNMQIENYKGLYGLNFIKSKDDGDYKVIQWFNKNVKGQPVILEAHGDSYSEYCRISMATGLPTIQGWVVHEWLWRNDYNKVKKRVDEVSVVYESDDLQETINILKKYKVQYIIVGNKEKIKYKSIKTDKLLTLGVEYKFGNTSVIKLN